MLVIKMLLLMCKFLCNLDSVVVHPPIHILCTSMYVYICTHLYIIYLYIYLYTPIYICIYLYICIYTHLNAYVTHRDKTGNLAAFMKCSK